MVARPLVVLDANVLYPFQLRNFLLHAAEFDVIPLDPAAYLVSVHDDAWLPGLARFLRDSGFLS